MIDPFEGLPASHAAAYLRRALDTGNVTHAYLVVGPVGCGHDQLAQRLAAALVADGDQEQFELAARGSHPDIHVIRPGSSVGYLVDQVREVVHDATLAPVRAIRKVYIVSDADCMQGAPANAFLKTLEEPPQSVHIILLASAEGGVLSTIRSRCQVLNISSADTAPSQEDPRAASAVHLAGRILSALGRGVSNNVVLTMAKDLVANAGEGIDDLKDAQAAAEKEAADYLSAGARKNLAEAHKREVRMEQHMHYVGLLDALEAWLRDCLVAAAGAPELASVAAEAAQGSLGMDMGGGAFSDPAKADIAHSAGMAGIIRAIEAVGAARRRIACNVTPQLALEAMLFEIREALCPR